MDWLRDLFTDKLPDFSPPTYMGETYSEFMDRTSLEISHELFDRLDSVKRKYRKVLPLARMLNITQTILRETFDSFLRKISERRDLWELGKRVPEPQDPTKCTTRCAISTIYDVCPCSGPWRTTDFIYCSSHRIPLCVTCGRSQNNAWWELEFHRLITRGELVSFTDMVLYCITSREKCIHEDLKSGKSVDLVKLISQEMGKINLWDYLDNSPIHRDGYCRFCNTKF